MMSLRSYASVLVTLMLCFGIFEGTGLNAQSGTAKTNTMNATKPQTSQFHGFKLKTLSGQDFSLEQLRGKRVLVVNTASECGFTPQYAQLQELYLEYGGDDFTIIGIPTNDFGGQEPGSNTEIASFCQKNYGVTFPMMSKESTKGDDQHPLFAWLTEKDMNGVSDAAVTWNFNKFLIDANGRWVAAFPAKVEPTDARIMTFAAGGEW